MKCLLENIHAPTYMEKCPDSESTRSRNENRSRLRSRLIHLHPMGPAKPKSSGSHDKEQLLEWVNQSGFPFQTALEALILETSTRWRWTVTHVEEAWKNGSHERDGFIDLIIENQPRTVALIIEAKRTLDTSWIFLVPDDRQMSRRHLKAWLTWSGKSPHFGWYDVTLEPRTPESQFCVVRGQDERALSMLERIGSDLISATEAYAWEDRPNVEPRTSDMRLYCSVIVTTATLRVCQYDPRDILLDVGKIPDADFAEVPVVRFRKQLFTRATTSKVPAAVTPSVESSSKEHAVFVVNATHFIDFLEALDIDEDAFRRLR